MELKIYYINQIKFSIVLLNAIQAKHIELSPVVDPIGPEGQGILFHLTVLLFGMCDMKINF